MLTKILDPCVLFVSTFLVLLVQYLDLLLC
uniref:Uncharacterized protein n=1 Tax=Arundo donax TaxID=35708 RepID=A0A0A9H1X2_ARUDO